LLNAVKGGLKLYGYINHLGQFIRPDVIEHNGEALHNPSNDILSERGYLLRVDTEPPNDTEYEAYYIEINGRAEQRWRKRDNTPTPEQRIAELEAALELLLSGAVE
jgi:hypothetical protein